MSIGWDLYKISVPVSEYGCWSERKPEDQKYHQIKNRKAHRFCNSLICFLDVAAIKAHCEKWILILWHFIVRKCSVRKNTFLLSWHHPSKSSILWPKFLSDHGHAVSQTSYWMLVFVPFSRVDPRVSSCWLWAGEAHQIWGLCSRLKAEAYPRIQPGLRKQVEGGRWGSIAVETGGERKKAR